MTLTFTARPRVAPFLGLIAAAALAGVAAPAGAQTPTHVYRVEGSLADALGGPSLVSGGGTVGASSYTFQANQGLTLANALNPDVYSLELSFTFAAVSDYRKVVDFKDRTVDAGVYVHNGRAIFHINVGNAPASQEAVVGAGAPAHLVLTRNADRRFAAYVDGVLAFSFADDFGVGAFTAPGQVASLFFDDRGSEASAGALHWARTYDVALTPGQVAARFAAGDNALAPTVTTPEPASVALLAFGLAAVGGMTVRRRRLATA